MSINALRSDERRMLWIVPRVPWPPRCGASIANCMLIQCMTQKGWQVDLLCLGQSAGTANIEEIRSHLQVDRVEIITPPTLLRFRLVRIFYALFHQIINRKIPLTAIHFAVGRVGRALKNSVSDAQQKLILWDGLHPMASLHTQTRKHSNLGSNDNKIHIYRAHNCETTLWSQYRLRVSRLVRPLISYQARLMADFEKVSLERASATLAINEADRHSLQNVSIDLKSIYVIPAVFTELNIQTVANQENPRKVSNDLHESRLTLLWMGGMNWWPNLEGLTWFITHVWLPLGIHHNRFNFNIVGQGTERFKKFSCGSLTVHGFVQDPKNFLNNTDILIVPILSGSGVRIKALEALSCGVACLGTQLGLEEIPREGCWIANSSQEWCEALLHITPTECKLRGQAGRGALKQSTSLSAVGDQLETLFTALVRSSNL